MSRLLICWCFCLSALPVFAQNASSPPAPTTITIVQKSVDELTKDLEFSFKLVKEDGAFKSISELISIYAEAVDQGKPLTTQILVRNSKFRYVTHLHLLNSKDFLSNIFTLGVETEPVRPVVRDLYKTKGLFEGFLKIAGNRAVIGEDRVDVTKMAEDVDAKIKSILDRGVDLGISIENDAAGIEERKAAFATSIRQEVLATVSRPKMGELQDEFALRRLVVEQQLDEFARYFEQASKINLDWTLSDKEETARFNVDLTAIPETELAKSIALLDSQKSRFATFKPSSNSPLSGLINYPLDEMHQQMLKKFFESSKPIARRRILAVQDRSEKLKNVDAAISDLVFDVLESGVAQAVFDGYVDVQKGSNGKYTSVGGLRVPGATVVTGLERLKQAGVNVELKVATEGKADIHRLKLTESQDELREIFGETMEIVVLTLEDTVFYAIGENAQQRAIEAMKSFDQIPADAPAGPALIGHVQFGPWVEVLDRVRGGAGPRRLTELRRIAIESFANGLGTLDVKLYRENDVAKLDIKVDGGCIRFGARLLAKFINETLN